MANTPLTFKGVPIVFRDDALDAIPPEMYYMSRDGVRSATEQTLLKRRPQSMIINDYGIPPKLLNDHYKYMLDAMQLNTPLVYKPGTSRDAPDALSWGPRAHLTSIAGRTKISYDEALDLGLDISKLVRVSPHHDYFYKPPKEYPVSKAIPVKSAKKVAAYNTIGVRFLDGPNLAKVYTYRLPKKARVHLGQEVVVPTDKSGAGYITQSVAVVVRIDKVQEDIYGYDYKFVTGTIKPL